MWIASFRRVLRPRVSVSDIGIGACKSGCRVEDGINSASLVLYANCPGNIQGIWVEDRLKRQVWVRSGAIVLDALGVQTFDVRCDALMLGGDEWGRGCSRPGARQGVVHEMFGTIFGGISGQVHDLRFGSRRPCDCTAGQ